VYQGIEPLFTKLILETVFFILIHFGKQQNLVRKFIGSEKKLKGNIRNGRILLESSGFKTKRKVHNNNSTGGVL
jgi:hypothetical protein